MFNPSRIEFLIFILNEGNYRSKYIFLYGLYLYTILFQTYHTKN